MRILVLGAGAVGGYFGGRLAEAGADVTFLVRPARAALLAEKGLRASSKAGNLNFKPRCVLAGDVKPEYDLVLLTAKAYDLESSVAAIAPALAGGKGCVLPLLNGMTHLETLDARFGGERVLGGVAYIASTLAPDGEILHMSDFHSIAFGPRQASQKPVCEAFAAAAAKAKCEFKLHDNILQAMWDKWVLLASLGGITCLMRAPIGDYVATEAGARIALALLAECAAVAAAEGFPTPAPVLASYRSRLTETGSPLAASMLRDVEGGGPAEGDHILSALLARARARGVAAPLLEIAATHLETYMRRRAREAAAKAS
jgi:2-dehydropantoate 2-reductase